MLVRNVLAILWVHPDGREQLSMYTTWKAAKKEFARRKTWHVGAVFCLKGDNLPSEQKLLAVKDVWGKPSLRGTYPLTEEGVFQAIWQIAILVAGGHHDIDYRLTTGRAFSDELFIIPGMVRVY